MVLNFFVLFNIGLFRYSCNGMKIADMEEYWVMGLISGKVIAELITSMLKNVSTEPNVKNKRSVYKSCIYYTSTILLIFGTCLFFSLYDCITKMHSIKDMVATIRMYKNIIKQSHAQTTMFDDIGIIYVIQFTNANNVPSKQLLTLRLKSPSIVSIHKKPDAIGNYKILILHINEKYP